MSEPILFGLPLHLLFLYFMMYAFVGWCMETVYCSIGAKKLVPRGFLFGPICPIYGVGVLMMICWFAPLMGNPLLFYVTATVGMSAWEYFVAWFLEATTHIKYWDYSMHKFNLKGRICLWVSLTWGVLAYIILYWVHPQVSRLVFLVPLSARHIIAIVLALVLLADTVTTIRKLALTTTLMRKLDETRVQLALGRAELEDLFEQAKEEFSNKLESTRDERTEELQHAYEELLEKVELHSRRFRNRYQEMSSKRYDVDLSGVKEFGAQVRAHIKQNRAQHKALRKQQRDDRRK